jgi:ferredoxin
MPIIKFIKEKKEVEVPAGTNLRKAALAAGVNPHSVINGFGAGLTKYLNCLGNGLCGTCRVNIVKGMENVSPMGVMEKIKFHNPIPDPLPALQYIGNEDKLRLSCQTLVNGDVEVETAPQLDLFGENFFS